MTLLLHPDPQGAGSTLLPVLGQLWAHAADKFIGGLGCTTQGDRRACPGAAQPPPGCCVCLLQMPAAAWLLHA